MRNQEPQNDLVREMIRRNNEMIKVLMESNQILTELLVPLSTSDRVGFTTIQNEEPDYWYEEEEKPQKRTRCRTKKS